MLDDPHDDGVGSGLRGAGGAQLVSRHRGRIARRDRAPRCGRRVRPLLRSSRCILRRTPRVRRRALSRTELLQSPLHDRHAALARSSPSSAAGRCRWSTPPAVGGAHRGPQAVGIFDVSHLGKALVTGPGAAAYVNATLTNDLGRIRPGKAQYTLCCDDETGGIVDDLIAYFHDDEHVLLVPNAANTAEVVRRLRAAAPAGVKVIDHHHEYAVLAVQGTQLRRGARGGRAARRPRLHVVRRGRLRRRPASWSAAPATPASAATS